MNKKLFMVICLLFLVPLAAVCQKAMGAEYYTYPMTGHPNYMEPSTFPTVMIDPEDAITLKDITPWATVKICQHVKDGDTIILNSGGGYIDAGRAIMKCVKDKDVTFAVEEAYSMATTIMLAGEKVCMFDDAPLGFHQPYYTLFRTPIYFEREELNEIYAEDAKYLRGLGYSELKIIYLERFGDIARDASRLAMMPHGTMAGILGDRFVGRCEYVDTTERATIDDVPMGFSTHAQR